MNTSVSTLPTRRPQTVAPSATPQSSDRDGLVIAERTAPDVPSIDDGLAVDVIDGDRVTLLALTSLPHSGAVAHRLTTLIVAGVRHINIDLRNVGTLSGPTIACLTDIAFHLSDSGGTLQVANAPPRVAAALEAARHAFMDQER